MTGQEGSANRVALRERILVACGRAEVYVRDERSLSVDTGNVRSADGRALLRRRASMRVLSARVVGPLSVIVLLSGTAGLPAAGAPDTPAELRPPGDQELVLEAHARGVQIYACSSGQDHSGHFKWAFKGPEAELFDRNDRKIGKHYGGPTWESTDGSTVVGEVKARDDGPDPMAIPWLLLTAKSNSGAGVLSNVKSIQRVRTVGGKAPTSPCGSENEQQVFRVPYKAVYYFYAPKR